MPKIRRRASAQRSRKVREASIGTHVADTSRRVQRTRMNLGDHRMGARASRSEVDQVMPQTTTRESDISFAARRRRTGFAIQDARRDRRRGYYLLAAVLLAAVLVALLVSRCAFGVDVSSKMKLDDAEAVAALTAPENDTDPYYTLVLGEYRDSEQEYKGPSLITVVRADPQTKSVCFISVPGNIQVELSDKQLHLLSEAQIVGGDAELITQINELLGITIAHIAKVDNAGFVSIVDSLGGIVVDVPQEVDDPKAGSTYIPAGEQKLDGQGALTLCRSSNYVDSVAVQARAQTNTLAAMLSTMASHSSLDFARTLDSVAPYVKTDFSADQVTKLFKVFSAQPTMYATSVPGSTTVEADGVFFSVSSASLASVMEAVNEGRDPNEKGVRSAIDPASITVTVRNGSGVTGSAAVVAEVLTNYGYQVVDTGNADAYVYEETLAVYKDETYQPAAQAIIDQLGGGRVTEDASVFYSFESDVLIIIGKDWKPMS